MVGKVSEDFEKILTHDALEFLASLHRNFNATRKQLMQAREELQKNIDSGSPIEVMNNS